MSTTRRKYFAQVAESYDATWHGIMLAIYDDLLAHVERCAQVGKTFCFLQANPKAAGEDGKMFLVDECNAVCVRLLQADGFDASLSRGGILICWSKQAELS